MEGIPLNPFASLIEEDIETHGLVERGDRVIVAVSGGPDSVALVLALDSLRHEMGIEIELAHVNHGLRGKESDGDERFVRDLAASLRLAVTVTRHDVAAERRRGESVESAARRIRYTDLAELAERGGAASVAVGHTRDDQAETILLWLLRGSRVSDLGGMAWSRPIRIGSHVRLIRPMLNVDRDEVEAFLEECGAECRRDSSNLDQSFVRNRIRHDLLPMLEQAYHPAIREFLLRMGEMGRSLHEEVAADGRGLVDEAETGPDRVTVPVQVLRVVRESAREAFLREAVCRLIDVPSLSAAAVKRLASLLEAEGSNRWAPLGNGLRARRVYDKIVIERETARPKRSTAVVRIRKSGKTAVPDLGITIEARRLSKPPKRLKRGPDTALLDADHIDGDLVVRTRRPGDRFHALGAPGGRKLKDVLIDRKVPADQRDHLPLICDDAGILWVVGHAIADRVKVTDNTTRVLRLHAHGI